MPRVPFAFRLLMLCLALVTGARGMSVVAPTFEQLVALSDTIVRGVVIDVRAEEFDSPDGRGIRTLVTFNVERALKGAPGANVTLSLLGGTAGRHTLRIPGMPQFHVGERQIVFFARNGEVLCPLIAAGHGRYHLLHDTAGREFIARDNGAPLVSTDQIVAPLDGATAAPVATSPARALTPAAFEAQIVTSVAQQAATRNRP